MPGQIKSSKPTLSGISSTPPSKNALSVNREGVLMERAGPIYMTHTITKTEVSTTTEEVLASVGVSTDRTCCEGTDLVSAVTQNATNAVSAVSTTETTEDLILPILYTDSYDNLMPIVRSTTSEDVYGGQPLKRRTN